MPNIFEKSKDIKPSQLVAVAERRFADAVALLETEENAHANGAQYLAGFVIEILLKARLMQRFSGTASRRANDPMSPQERRIWNLVWRSHDLHEMLPMLPELEAALSQYSQRSGTDCVGSLKSICATWSIQARYSTHTSTIAQAREFVERVRKLKELLK